MFATCRRPDSARRLHALRAEHRERLSIVPLDVSDADSIRAAHRTVRRETDGLDVLINNAGIYSARGSADPAERWDGCASTTRSSSGGRTRSGR